MTDDFNTSYDYTSGTGGDPFFDGQQFNGGFQSPNSDPTLQTADANMTNPGELTVSSTNGHWEQGDDNGFLLYRNVTGDFSAVIHITDAPYVNYNTAGVMARNPDLTNGENWVGSQLIGNFGAGPSQRNTVDSVGSDTHAADETSYSSGYLELTRVGGLFSTLYSTDGLTYELVGSVDRPDLPSTLEVGLYQASYSGNQGTATFDDFSITEMVPEPSTWAMMLGGLVGLTVFQAKRRKLARA